MTVRLYILWFNNVVAVCRSISKKKKKIKRIDYNLRMLINIVLRVSKNPLTIIKADC